MKLISHRGNLTGPNPILENSPDYIDKAIEAVGNVEIDLWCIDSILMLGHDNPQYEVEDYRWMSDRSHNLWIHCKNKEALGFCGTTSWHYFWHETDQYTLTSRGWVWAYPSAPRLRNAIIAVPELFHGGSAILHMLSERLISGICSDRVVTYKDLLER